MFSCTATLKMSQNSGQSKTSPENFLRSVFGNFILGVHDVLFGVEVVGSTFSASSLEFCFCRFFNHDFSL